MLFATLPRRRGPGDVESASFIGDRSIHAFPAAWVELVPAGVRDDQLHSGYEVLLKRVPFVCTWLPHGSRAPEDSASMFVRRYCRAVMLQASSRYCYGVHIADPEPHGLSYTFSGCKLQTVHAASNLNSWSSLWLSSLRSYVDSNVPNGEVHASTGSNPIAAIFAIRVFGRATNGYLL